MPPPGRGAGHGVDGWRKLLARHRLEVGCYTTYRTKGHEDGFPGFAEFIGASGGGLVVRESQYGRFAAEELEAHLRRFFQALQPEIELARKHRVRLAIKNPAGWKSPLFVMKRAAK